MQANSRVQGFVTHQLLVVQENRVIHQLQHRNGSAMKTRAMVHPLSKHFLYKKLKIGKSSSYITRKLPKVAEIKQLINPFSAKDELTRFGP